jgi:aminoglycoside phosphotransferase (APT) family kinase protein
MPEIITNAAELTPAWLTEALSRNGHLGQGTVAGISMQTFQSYFADFYQLKISYSSDAAPKLPTAMILKVPFGENQVALDMEREEVLAYRKLFEAMPALPIPRCFDSRMEDETGRSQILLEDLSATHFRGEQPEDLSLRQWELCVETLAELHAFYWESAALGTEIGTLFDAAEIERVRKFSEESMVKFFAEMDGELSPEMRRAFENTLEFYPEFWRGQLTTRRRNTLIHGDAHSWNFLFPKDAENGRAVMIDLATLRVRPATNDLAYLMAMKWQPERRARLELPLLRHYHSALVSRGVKDYSWEDCLLDYRHSILTHLFTPAVQCASGALSPGIWQANLKRITAAFADLRCGELL